MNQLRIKGASTNRRLLPLLVSAVTVLLFFATASAQDAAVPAPPKATAPAPADQPPPRAPASTPDTGDNDEHAETAADAATAASNYSARAAAAQSRLDSLSAEIADEALRGRVAEQWKDAFNQWQIAQQAAEAFARRKQAVADAAARQQAIRGEGEALRAKAASAAEADAGHSIVDMETELRELDLNIPEWTKQLAQRVARIESQPQRLAESRKAAEEAQARLAEKHSPVADDLPPELKAAMREARTARTRADHEIVAGSDYYRNIQEPILQLEAAERDLLSLRIEFGKTRREQLSGAIADRRRQEAETLRRESDTAAARFLGALPQSFRDIAKENRELSAALDQLLAREKERAARLQSASEYMQGLKTDYDHINWQLESGGGGQALGSYLWTKRRALQREAYQAGLERDRINNLSPGFSFGSLDDLRRRIPRLEQELASFPSRPEVAALPENIRAELLERARTLLDNHSKLISNLSDSVQRQSATLIDLEAANKELRGISNQYADLVDRYVLRLPGSPPLWRLSYREIAGDAWRTLKAPEPWRELIETLARGLWRSPALLILLLLCLAPTLAARILTRPASSKNIAARTPVAATPRGMLWRAGRAFIRSYPAPMASFIAGAALWSAADPGGNAAAVGEALLAAAAPWLLLNLWRRFCDADGLLELYTKTPRALLDRLYRRLTTILRIGLPLWMAAWFTQDRVEPAAFQAIGGIVSTVLAALGVGFWLMRMRPSAFLRNTGVTSARPWQVIHFIVTALGLFWFVMSFLGYNYGALLVISKASVSGLIITIIAVAAQYWLLRLIRSREIQRARAILYYRFSEESRKRREERFQEQSADSKPAAAAQTATAPAATSPVPEDERVEHGELALAERHEIDRLAAPAVAAAAVSIPASVEGELEESLLNARKLVWWLAAAAVIMTLFRQWADILPAREWFDKLTLFPRGDGSGLGLRDIILALAGGGLCFAVANPLGSWINLSFFGWNPAERGTRVATAALVRYAVLGAGVIWVAHILGMAWSDAQWLVAALGVGLGFGLQEIILNFVSGIILLFERPVRVGDMVTIGSAEGAISRINIRTTTLIDADRRELIIPNKELVTGRVVNWTLSDSITRTVIPVRVAYGSNLELAQRLLLQAARNANAVLDDPAPSVYFTDMADSSLIFELRVFTGRLEDRMPTQHKLRLDINRLFQRHGIEIPFPQMDVHMRTE